MTDELPTAFLTPYLALLLVFSTVSIAVLLKCVGSAIINIFFHPLSKHPGPKLWAASRLPWCWNQYNGVLSHRLTELHRIYGPVVRIAPDEISYITERAWKTIYGQRSVEMAKDPNFSLLTPSGVQNILTADRDTHNRQRRVMSHAFSEKALREQESILQSYCTKLCVQLEDRCAYGTVNMSEWFTFATFDLIGDLSFGQSFGCLDSGKPHPFVESIKSGSRELMIHQMLRYYRVPGRLIPFILGCIVPGQGVAGSRAANMRRAIETVKSRIARGPTADRRDFWHYILKYVQDEDTVATGDEMTTGKRAMCEAEMFTNAFSISIAGSDGTATALAGAIFLMLQGQGAAYRRAAAEIHDAFVAECDITSSTVSPSTLPYLDAVLHEAIRLYPPVAITLPRRVPAHGETIDGRFVSAGYTVGVNHLACYRSEANFKDADHFRPERWLNGATTNECFHPFSHGPRSCLGKNLAWAEMRLLLARLLWRFHIELVEDGRNLQWLDDQKIWGFWAKPPLLCRLTPLHQK